MNNHSGITFRLVSYDLKFVVKLFVCSVYLQICIHNSNSYFYGYTECLN